jgi:hypothetical protein
VASECEESVRAGGVFLCLCELRVSQQISTFYGLSVQARETRLGARQRRRPRWFTAVVYPRLQRPVASEDEASACSELRLGCHAETPVIEPYPVDLWETREAREGLLKPRRPAILHSLCLFCPLTYLR